MSGKTKKTLIISLIVMMISMGTLVFLFYKIEAQNKLMEEHINIIAENGTKEATYSHINRIVQETEQDRARLAGLYLSDESDSINLLNEIETLAPTFGLEFKTEALEKVRIGDDGPESIKMTFSYSGRKDKVFGFTKMIESIPYHSTVESLSLKEVGGGDFTGKITVFITIQPT